MALTKVTGSVIKDSVSLSGNVSVGGTLTYQDVTNVDALGIGTFRTGIKVLAGQVDVGSNIKLGNAGVITATSFVGSGANLTSLPAQATIANNADNRVITGGSGVNLNGEANLTFDGSALAYSAGGSERFNLAHTSGGHVLIKNPSAASLAFGTNNAEKARIDSSGRLRVASTTESADGAFDDLIVGNHSGNRGISILSTNGQQGAIGFAKSGTLADGYVAYVHNSTATSSAMTIKSSGHIQFNAGSAEKLRITSGGVLTFPTAGIGLHNSATNSYFFAHGSNETRLYHAANNQVKLAFRKNGDVYQGAVNADDNGIGFFTKSSGSSGEEWGIRCKPDSETELFYNGNARLYTTNTGISINSNTLIASTGADDVQIGDGTGNAGITIYSNASNNGAIYFGDGTGGTNPYSGFLQYYHSSNSFAIGTLGGEKVVINSVGRQMNRCTTRFNREAYTKGGTIHGGGAATGANTGNPGAFVFLNDTPVRGSNTRYSFWMQSGDEYPNSSNFIDIDIGNSYMYRVLIKGSHSSVTAEMSMFLIYGLANSSGNYAPRIQQVTTSTPSFNGDHGGGSGSQSFALNSGQFNCRVMGYGTSGGTRGSLGTYNTTLRIEYTGNNNQGLLAFIERWDTGT